MNKKIKVLGLLIVVLGLLINAGLGYRTAEDLTDEYIVTMYLIDELGDGHYDVAIVEGTNDECIKYEAYESGKVCKRGTIKRDYYTNKYKQL